MHIGLGSTAKVTWEGDVAYPRERWRTSGSCEHKLDVIRGSEITPSLVYLPSVHAAFAEERQAAKTIAKVKELISDIVAVCSDGGTDGID